MDLTNFDPDAPGAGGGLFGLPQELLSAKIQVIPVPWEATTSYGRGTRGAPGAVQAASLQVDLFDLEYGDIWRAGIRLREVHPDLELWADQAERDALAVISGDGTDEGAIARVDALGDRLNAWVYREACTVLDSGGIPAVLGGDHSCPYGLIQAIGERYPGVGVLHVDAHADLRESYLGFRWSHASIFYNSLQLPGVGKLVGVAWRDVGSREMALVNSDARITMFSDLALSRAEAEGESWVATVDRIIAELPEHVYVSFDIDGLDPALCPRTGTPVPGGLSWRQALVLLSRLSAQRKVVGFDLCEVGVPSEDGSDEWDANVGARLLYKLCGCAVRSGSAR